MNKKRLSTIEQKADGVLTVGEVMNLARTMLFCVDTQAKPTEAAKVRVASVSIFSKGLKIDADRIRAALL